MSLHDAMRSACDAIGIIAPARTALGRWTPCPVDGKSGSNRSGRVMVNADGQSGVAWNHVSGQHMLFSISGDLDMVAKPKPQRDVAGERKRAEEHAEVARICDRIVRAATPRPHPYLDTKGFPDECGLVLDDIRPIIPTHDLGQAIARALPEGDGPWLIVPGRIAQQVATVQIISPDGGKKNIFRGKMSGASHRIATGRETWVCEGIATALTVRAALRFLGRSATVLSAFSAANVAKVASRIGGCIIAADHDKPQDALHGVGAGEYYARGAGRDWTQPPEIEDFNDMHQRGGLRAVALHLRGIRPP